MNTTHREKLTDGETRAHGTISPGGTIPGTALARIEELSSPMLAAVRGGARPPYLNGKIYYEYLTDLFGRGGVDACGGGTASSIGG